MTNEAEVEISAYTPEGHEIKIALQMVVVTKPLLAVRKICAAGNRVVFDDEEPGSYIEDKASGARTAISKEDGTDAVWVWVMVPEEASRENNPFNGLESVDQDEEVEFNVTGFTRLAAN